MNRPEDQKGSRKTQERKPVQLTKESEIFKEKQSTEVHKKPTSS